ncbi:Uncharacterised protein [Streptococcus pneumoniae]|nr:Uncharacterised protein [Streptococcus pneumoniae]
MNALQLWEKLNKLLKGAISVIANGIFLLRMYGDIENFAIRVADYFYEKGDLSRSNEYYRADDRVGA